MYQNSSFFFFKYLSLMSEYITFSEKQNFITKPTNERKDTDKVFFQILLRFKSLKSAIVMRTLYILRKKKMKMMMKEMISAYHQNP